MIVHGSASNAQLRRRQIDVGSDIYHKSEWLESGQDPLLSPTIFLVEQPPNTHLPGHFHGENQFQVFVRGAGRIGTHAIGPISVHYAGAYTGYGPLIAGPEGVFYFTIRAVYEAGMMRATDVSKMVRGPKRQCVSEQMTPVEPAALARLLRVEAEDLISMQPDGIGARVLRLPPDEEASGVDPASGGGQFYIVLGGELLHGGKTLQHWESLFVSHDEQAVSLKAGRDGLEVLCMQMARKDPVYIAAKQAAMTGLQAPVI
jgi:hypothetical protein